MASSDDACSTDHKASIALLRRVRAGEHVHFVHHVDVCDAVPEILVADLEPVPGTGLDDGGYSSVWYCYHAKKFTNMRGELSGHRQRKITGGNGASWHSEIGRKHVKGSDGGTFCNCSYGRKPDPSAPSIDRIGWCMVEYDFVAADKKQDEDATAASNHVLCKLYRTPRPKGKSSSASASASSSSKKKQTAGKKRKADGGDHPEASKRKSIHQQQEQEQVRQESACYQYEEAQAGVESLHGGDFDFDFNIEDINFYVDDLEQEPGPGLQQPIAEPERDVEFTQPPCAPVFAAETCNVGFGDMVGPETAVPVPVQHGDKEVNREELFTELGGQQQQQPIVEPPPAHGGEFVQMPWGPMVPVVAEATVEDMLGFGPETMYGQCMWSGGMATTESVPWTWSSSYAPASSFFSQGPDPFQLPI